MGDALGAAVQTAAHGELKRIPVPDEKQRDFAERLLSCGHCILLACAGFDSPGDVCRMIKKIPGPIKLIRGFPVLSSDTYRCSLSSEAEQHCLQAGFLTPGLS
jgi:hypothetical protein